MHWKAEPACWTSEIFAWLFTRCLKPAAAPINQRRSPLVPQAPPASMRFCVALLLVLASGARAEIPPPEDCRAVAVEGCAGSEWNIAINGEYVLYSRSCPGATADHPVYHNNLTNMFLYHFMGYWRLSSPCGTDSFNAYNMLGNAASNGVHPFVDTSPTWACASGGSWAFPSMSISCSFFIGDHIECESGTHNTTGFGPEGKCNNKCPVHLPLSFPGSTSANDCFTPYANILTVSNSVNRITAFSPDSKKHGLLTEGEKVDEPMDIVFISSTEFLVSMWDKNAVVLMNVEGEVIGDFAHVLHPWGLLFLPDLRMVAVAKNSYPYESLIFFSVDDFENGGTLVDTHIASDSVEEVLINIAGASGEPCYLSLGEMDDEVLATTWDGHVVRVCVPTTSCNPAKRNRRMLDGGWSLRGIGVIRQLGVYLVVEYSYERVYSCPIASTDSRLNSDCSTFADQPEGTDWDPYNLQVDEAKHLVYVADRTFSIIHVFSFGGDYFGHLAQNPLFLTLPDALAFKPGPLAAISPITPPSAATAGEPIITPFTLHDRANIPLPTNYNITKDLPRFRITATGLKDGLTTTIHGSVPSASEAHILVKFAGVWTVSITEGIKNPQNLFGSPYEIAVKPAETDPAECEAEFERVFTAGASFSLNITAGDAFRNPTEGMEFEFSCCVGEAMNKAGEYTVEVTPAIKGSPFNFDVKPSDPDAASSTHNIDIGDDTGLVSFKERFLDLRVFPKDRFNNTITDATGYAVSIDGALPTVLAAPEFSHSYTIPADYKGDIEVAFTLNGTNIKGSPVIIKVAPADIIKTEIAAIAFGVLALVSLVLYGRQKKKAARDIRGVAQAGMEKVAKMADQQQALQKMNSVLEESLRKKKHSEDELEVMKKAMTSVSAQRQEELKGVLIPSSGVKIDRLLGKGGFGVVNLATYNGQFVAMKQLLTIDINSVKRFR